MLIKVIFCTKDTVYAKRLSNYFDKIYGDKIDVDICSSMEETVNSIYRDKIDMALFGDEFEDEVLKRIKDISCTCAVMTEQIYESDGNELRKIGKFQRGDKIYRNILELYSSGQKVKYVSLNDQQWQDQKVYAFISASGGMGTTTIAKAYAQKCAAYEKVLYLDLGLFNLSEAAEGNANGLDEILLALKSRRNVLPYKLQSAVLTMKDRVFTYGSCSNEADLLELNAEDMDHLLHGITALSEYRKVIIDIGSSIFIKEVELIKKADVIVCIVDESDIGRKKYEKLYLFLKAIENKEKIHLIKKMLIFRNKIKQDYSYSSWDTKIGIAGWAPYVSVNSYDAVIERIAQSDAFSNLEIRNAE